MRLTRPQALGFANALALVWVGMLFGVSFLATPAKFLAPSLSLGVALDVGRHTFEVFSVIEVAAAFALLTAAVLIPQPRRILFIAESIAALVALELVWLLPMLDARVELILQGGDPPPSVAHSLYVAVDAAKLLLLAGIAWYSQSARRGPSGSVAIHGG